MKTESLAPLKSGYDLIGDIHGHARQLRKLLSKLGYHERDGCYRHPHRRVIFVGDFIDRGPEIRETLQIVRSMIDGGTALAVMGNHEFNALCYHTIDPDGKPLREHSPKNKDQHQSTLDAFADHPEEWQDYLSWFRSLPLYLDLGELRVVHAAWDENLIAALQGCDRLDEVMLHQAAVKGTPANEAVEVLLKGREIRLPDGRRFLDKSGFSRSKIRTKWWLNGAGRTFRDMVFPDNDEIPAVPLSADMAPALRGYAEAAAPVFVGHYWLPPQHPKTPVTANVACLDYSVAKGGPLVAYRWNSSEPLRDDGFLSSDHN